jgi:muconolactone delta-isomerase
MFRYLASIRVQGKYATGSVFEKKNSKEPQFEMSQLPQFSFIKVIGEFYPVENIEEI